MRCNNCSAPLPEGSKFCNACGAALSPECRNMSGEELRKATQKELMFIRERVVGISYEVGRLYKCQWAALIISLIGIVMSGWYWIQGDSYWDYLDIYGDHTWYLIITVIVGIAAIIVMICTLVVLNDLKDYHSRFQIVFALILFYVGISVVGYFLNTGLAGMIVTILGAGAMFCYVYNLYGSMADLSGQFFGKLVGRWIDAGDLADEWKRLIIIYAVVFGIQVIFSVYSSIRLLDDDTLSAMKTTAFLTLIGRVGLLVVSILEVRLFKKTWNSLERLEYSKVNTKI